MKTLDSGKFKNDHNTITSSVSMAILDILKQINKVVDAQNSEDMQEKNDT